MKERSKNIIIHSNMIICVENCKESIKKLIGEFSKVTE